MNVSPALKFVSCAAILASAAVLSLAGPISPPPGPVSSQYKTLSEVEPRRIIRQSDVPLTITQPGSYYLVESLFAPQLVSALITVASPGVSVDLRGFELDGSTDVGEATDCIAVQAAATGVTIQNGSIRQGVQEGVDCDATGGSFRNLTITGCGASGISAPGDGLFESCIANDNTGTGLAAGSSSVVRGCTAARNGVGFSGGGAMDSCTARDNTGDGIGFGGAITGCSATGNGGDGFSLSGSASGCSATGNGASGFSASNGMVTDCRADTNLTGILLVSHATARRCTLTNNGGVGISLGLRCAAIENSCSLHLGGPAIGVTQMFATGNRIEGNSLETNDVGIRVTTTGNIANGNTPDYDIAADNTVGQILDVSGADITTTNPWRNFSY